MLLGLVSIGEVLIGVCIVSTGWVLAATLLEALKKAAQKTDPIPLPNGRNFVTLKWQAAVEALIMVVEGRGPLMHTRIGMMRALNRRNQPAPKPRRKRAKAYRIVR